MYALLLLQCPQCSDVVYMISVYSLVVGYSGPIPLSNLEIVGCRIRIQVGVALLAKMTNKCSIGLRYIIP